MATHVQELDRIMDNVQDLQIEMAEEGNDEVANTLDTVLEELRGIDLSNGESEEEPTPAQTRINDIADFSDPSDESATQAGLILLLSSVPPKVLKKGTHDLQTDVKTTADWALHLSDARRT